MQDPIRELFEALWWIALFVACVLLLGSGIYLAYGGENPSAVSFVISCCGLASLLLYMIRAHWTTLLARECGRLRTMHEKSVQDYTKALRQVEQARDQATRERDEARTDRDHVLRYLIDDWHQAQATDVVVLKVMDGQIVRTSGEHQGRPLLLSDSLVRRYLRGCRPTLLEIDDLVHQATGN